MARDKDEALVQGGHAVASRRGKSKSNTSSPRGERCVLEALIAVDERPAARSCPARFREAIAGDIQINIQNH